MTMTEEHKRAFRIAYGMLERTEIPAGTPEEKAEAFRKIAAEMNAVCSGCGSLLVHLMSGIYGYLEAESR